MGYDPATETLTPNTPIADLRPSSAHSAGNGLPTANRVCGPNPYYHYPTWLKGVVYLKAAAS
jgi:hypothetical protein